MLKQSRRDFFCHTGVGFAGLAAQAMLSSQAYAESSSRPVIDSQKPLEERPPHLPAKAKQVIFLYQYGGPATIDLLDYKPELKKLHGQKIPDSFKKNYDRVGGVFKSSKEELMFGPWNWSQHGQTGHWVSDLLPHTAKHIDKLCQVRSMFSESSNHAPATYLLNTGAILGGKPSLGSWVTYGLGSLNQNLPGYVLLYKVAGFGGTPNWSNGFLPAAFQGTQFHHEGSPVYNLESPEEFANVQRSTLDLAQALNRQHAQKRSGVLDLDGRIASYELAYRMQSEALDIGELSSETLQTQQAYGIHDQDHNKAMYGRMCLLSRRLIEKGVRFIQLYQGVDKYGWDGHSDNTDYHTRNAHQTDQPTAALLGDLEQRGLLDSTLVIWAGEFGRTPMLQGEKGRNHNPYGYTIWMAGGGVKSGTVIGSTDEIGLRAQDQPQSVKNLHATILTALGFKPDNLFFEANGRQERITGVANSWNLIPGVL